MHRPFYQRRYFNCTLLSLGLTGYWSAALAKEPRKVLILGDSISAEYGLQRGQGWVSLMNNQLAAQKISATLINASLSGETTAGGRSRLPALLSQHQPQVVVIELGGNDALRGLALTQTLENLKAMAMAAKNAGARVLLLGMQMPPNYGADYAKEFAAVYSQTAQSAKAQLLPFFLKGIGDDADPMKWFQADRIHPNAAAQPQLVKNVWSALQPLLR